MAMRSAALYSGLMHATILAALVLGLPSFVEPLNETVVPLDIVTPEEIDEVAQKSEPEPEPPEPKAEEKAPEPEPPQQQAKVEPEPTPPAPEPEPEPLPEPEPMVEAEPEPVPPPEPKPEPKPKPEIKAKPTPPVPARRPDVKIAKPKKKKPKPDQLTSILRNVEKLKDQPRPAPQKKAAKAPEKGESRPLVSAFEQNEMVQAIQRQLRACWRLDPGARAAEDLVVEIRVMLNPDGSVRQAQIVDVVRMVQDAYFRSAAENAKRAIDVCSPFRLPIRKYDVWRELTLRFNPREMFGT